MTDFDKKLIERATGFSRFNYWHINALIIIADTEQARIRLAEIRNDLMDSARETL